VEGYVGQPVLLELALADRASGKYPRARIFDSSGVQLGVPIPMVPVPAVSGLYRASWVSGAAGQYSAFYDVYADAGFTVMEDYEPGLDMVRVHVTDPDVGFQRTLGHLGENVRDDVLGYDANNRPLSFRRRIFPDKATADASTPGGTGEGEIATIVGAAAHFDPARWETLLRTVLP